MKPIGAVISLVGVILLGSPIFAATCPESVPAPTYNVGDRFVWEYTTSGEKVWKVVGINGGLTEIKWTDPDSPLPRDNAGTYFLDQEWVITKGLDKQGEAIVSPRPNWMNNGYAMVGKRLLDFPLQLGKSWDVKYIGLGGGSSPRPGYLSLKVVGCEEVATKAGRFEAVKIEGTVTDLMNSYYQHVSYWYSAMAKNIIKFRAGRCIPTPGMCTASRSSQEFDLITLELK